jgi:hypothetical protein
MVCALDRILAMKPVKRWQDLSREERRAALLNEALYGILIVLCVALMLSAVDVFRWAVHHAPPI